MLDLQNVTKTRKLYEIKYVDGTILTLKMPSQKLFMDIMGLQDVIDNPLNALSQIYEIVTQILNLNTQDITYEVGAVMSDIDMTTAVLIIQDYLQTTTKTLGE